MAAGGEGYGKSELFQALVNKEKLNKGVDFIEFFFSVIRFVDDSDNKRDFFDDIRDSEGKRRRIRGLLLDGIDLFFNGNSNYRTFVNQVFDGDTDLGGLADLVLSFMQMAQDSSSGQKVSGTRKHAFVKQGVMLILRFSGMEEGDLKRASVIIDRLINALAMAKKGALGGLPNLKFADLPVPKRGCCGFF